MVTERVAIWDFFILYSRETFCDFVKNGIIKAEICYNNTK